MMTMPDHEETRLLKIRQLLKAHWGHAAFRPMQEQIILSVLSGTDTLALLPTGGGKSICYQLPALYHEGLCLVISPLIALMNDQVQQLRKKNITAFTIQAGMNRNEVSHILRSAAESNCKLLYVSPERLNTALFKEYLPALDIRLIAVDEAHCFSQWGYDFRPSYLRIAELRAALPDVPVLALTASATLVVQEDLKQKLLFQSTANVFRQSFARPNLSYSVYRPEVKLNKIVEILEKVPGSSLIYCKSRKRCQEICDALKLKGFTAAYYHAGLTREERTSRQQDWLSNKINTMVCTTAFGMGIDKPDVRLVIHADLPDCLENYYQESGRAGRDGARAYAVLLYREPELAELQASVTLRFPEIDVIRDIYQSIVNYLQLPSGHGEGNSYDFDFTEFIQRFRYHPQVVLAVLKALEQEELLTFNEQVFVPSKVQFVCDKDYLYDFESSYPETVPLIQYLLRNHEGLFTYPASISEKNLAYHLKSGEEQVVSQLKWLLSRSVIDYQPRKDKPQLFFLQNRVPASQLTLDLTRMQKRKEEWLLRTHLFRDYLQEEKNCRSRFIGNYFGDMELGDCGICDNCLKAKRKPLDAEEFNLLRGKILQLLQQEPQPANQLVALLPLVNKEKIWAVIDKLQSEQEISQDSKGILRVMGPASK
jgi:ATP-dependent DNA helicase RecQ